MEETLEGGRDRGRLLGGGSGRHQLDRGPARTAFPVGRHMLGAAPRPMTKIPVLDHDTVLAAVSTGEAVERVREAFTSFARGEWQMPAKLYLPSLPNGDFRAMPVRGEGLAMLKWIT